MNKIETRNLHKSFDGNVILKDINLKIPANSSFVIIGNSGSGKSVLIKSIVGLIKPNSGEVFIDGQEIDFNPNSSLTEFHSKCGFLFQGNALFDSLTIWRNICFVSLKHNKVTISEAREMASHLLDLVGLSSDILDLYPASISGGMAKRVALARAISTNPEIVFFDEPTTGPDPIMTRIIDDLIIKVREVLKATTITISHDIASVKRIATNIAMIYDGQIIWQGSSDELENTDNPYVQQFTHGQINGPIKV